MYKQGIGVFLSPYYPIPHLRDLSSEGGHVLSFT